MSFLLFAVVVSLMLGVYMMSGQEAAASHEISDKVTSAVSSVGTAVGSFQVRKFAHFAMYALLGLALIAFLYVVLRSLVRAVGLAFVICLIYSLLDELHQHFVPGRDASLKDLLFDAAGYGVGVIVALVAGLLSGIL